jgi:hypothetical protein
MKHCIVTLIGILFLTLVDRSIAVQGYYFGNGSVKALNSPELFYNSMRFTVNKNGKVIGSAVSFSSGSQPVKRLKLKGTISKVKKQPSGLTTARITGKFSDGSLFNGTLSMNRNIPGGAKSAKGKITRGSARGDFYGDGSGGSIVHIYSSEIEVMNLSTGSLKKFPAMPFEEGGVSVSSNGTIAHLQQRERDPEGVLVRLNQLDGTFIREFLWAEPNSFVKEGARISPNGKYVAFCLRVPDDRGSSRTYVFDTTPPHNYTFWTFTCSPGWTVDNRLLATNEGGNQIYISNPEVNFLSPVGPSNLKRAGAPDGSPDGKSIIFYSGDVSKTYSLNIATGVPIQLLNGSLTNFNALCGGKSLFYVQSCCTSVSLPTIHHVPLEASRTIPLTIGGYFLGNQLDDTMNVSDRFGYTPASQ